MLRIEILERDGGGVDVLLRGSAGRVMLSTPALLRSEAEAAALIRAAVEAFGAGHVTVITKRRGGDIESLGLDEWRAENGE